MRKLTFFLATLLAFSMMGCSTPFSNREDEKVIKADCYVVCVKPNGFVASINGVGDVFIKYANAKEQIDVFDTVIVEYYETDLIEKNGAYVDARGERARYSYQIKSPKSIRVADPSKGELVFG